MREAKVSYTKHIVEAIAAALHVRKTGHDVVELEDGSHGCNQCGWPVTTAQLVHLGHMSGHFQKMNRTRSGV